MKTSAYVQVVGFIDQTKINIAAGDYGGEMDPHGADLRGNPIGGLVFSEACHGSPEQVIEWHLFLGGIAPNCVLLFHPTVFPFVDFPRRHAFVMGCRQGRFHPQAWPSTLPCVSSPLPSSPLTLSSGLPLDCVRSWLRKEQG